MIPRHQNQQESGFIALITAITLSLILILVAAALNQTEFFTRSAAQDAEYKEKSFSLAEACADEALLKLAANPAYAGGETIPIDSDTCTVRPIDPTLDPITIETKAAFQDSITNLRVKAKNSDLSVQSWDELPSF